MKKVQRGDRKLYYFCVPMNREIIRLALPNILINLTVPMLGMVDMYLMGHQDSVQYMGAVALGAVIFNFVYWGFAFLRMSISGIAAQSYGRDNQQEMTLVLQRGLLLALLGGLLLLIFQIPLANFSFWLLDGTTEVKMIAKEYFYVRIWAAPAAILLMVFYGWFLGMQNAVYPMVIAIIVNVVNIIASFIFVRYFNMQAKGVALGSVLGQYSGLVLAIVLYFKTYSWTFPFYTFRIKPLVNKMGQLMNVSGDIFIRTICIIAVFTFFTSYSAGMGDVTLAVNSALLQYVLLFSYFLDGFAYAAEALVGKFYGGNDQTKQSMAVKRLLYWGLGFAVIFTLLYATTGNFLLSIFTDQESVILEGRKYLLWLIFMPLVSFASYIWDGVFIGMTASRAMRNSVLFSSIGFFFLPFYLLHSIMGNHAIWLAMFLFMGARSFSLTWMYSPAVKE